MLVCKAAPGRLFVPLDIVERGEQSICDGLRVPAYARVLERWMALMKTSSAVVPLRFTPSGAAE